MRLADRQAVVEDSAERRALDAGSRAVAKRVHKLGLAKRRDLHAAVKSKDRTLVSLDDIIELAINKAWIVPSGDGWKPGESRPV